MALSIGYVIGERLATILCAIGRLIIRNWLHLAARQTTQRYQSLNFRQQKSFPLVQKPAVLNKVKCRPLTDSEGAQEDNKVLRGLNPAGTFQMTSLQGIEGV